MSCVSLDVVNGFSLSYYKNGIDQLMRWASFCCSNFLCVLFTTAFLNGVPLVVLTLRPELSFNCDIHTHACTLLLLLFSLHCVYSSIVCVACACHSFCAFFSLRHTHTCLCTRTHTCTHTHTHTHTHARTRMMFGG